MNEFIRKRIVAENQLKAIGFSKNKDTTRSGIYLYERTDETGIRLFYVGQAKNLFDRQVGHLTGYKMKIDNSLRKRGLLTGKNPNGWGFKILEYCPENEMNDREQYYIRKYIDEGRQAYNLTLGSQGEGKVYMDNHKAAKGYYDGLEQGRKNVKREIAHWFKLYLTYDIKEGKKEHVNAKRAYDKFTELLNEEVQNGSSDDSGNG